MDNQKNSFITAKELYEMTKNNLTDEQKLRKQINKEKALNILKIKKTKVQNLKK